MPASRPLRALPPARGGSRAAVRGGGRGSGAHPGKPARWAQLGPVGPGAGRTREARSGRSLRPRPSACGGASTRPWEVGSPDGSAGAGAGLRAGAGVTRGRVLGRLYCSARGGAPSGRPQHGCFTARVEARGIRICRQLTLSANIFSPPDDLITKGRLIVNWSQQGFQVHFCVKRWGGRSRHQPHDLCLSTACSQTGPSLLVGVEMKNHWAVNLFSLKRTSSHSLSLSFPS